MKQTVPLYLTEKKKQEYLKSAAPFADLSYQFLWEMPASNLVPRSFAVTVPQTHGCLVCGHSVMEHGNYPYILDYINNRWKIVCPSCGYTFPTNDFEAYYKGGLDEHGFFKPDLAKKHNRELIAKGARGNLVNILYPEKGESWGVDDGYGYTDPETGIHYSFIGYYNHFAWSFTKKTNIVNLLTIFKNAYLASDDLMWAEKGIVLLDRVADVYPELSIASCPLSLGYLNSNGGGIDKGKAVGSIWECGVVASLMDVFAAFADLLKQDCVPNAVAFLKEKNHRNRKWGRPQETAQTIYDRIMHGIVAQVYPSVMSTDIAGNHGMHQGALAKAAVLWDKMPETKEWLDFNFRTDYGDRFRCYGGSISDVLVNLVDRDGYGNESSPGYNSGWLLYNLWAADALDGYELEGYSWDLYNHPKFRKMFFTIYQLILSDIYTAKIGDSAACGDPNYSCYPQVLLKGFLKYGAPELAQAAYYLAQNNIDNLDTTGFIESPETVKAKVQAVIEQYGTLQLRGTNLTRYGFTALRDGTQGDMWIDPKNSDQRAMWLYYGRNTGHGHKDTLNMGIIAYGLDISPDMGYPRYADHMDMHRISVTTNTISHNTVVVNDSRQTDQVVGMPLHYDWSEPVKLIDVSAPTAYKDIVDTYRRTSAMIRIGKEDSYIVDFFRISGGESHCYSFHGAEHANLVIDGLNLSKQADADGKYIGTYAGADTVYPDNADVRDISAARYLINVEKQVGSIGAFSVDYNVVDTWDIYGNGKKAPTDVHLKLNMLGSCDEVVVADLMPPENKPGNPKTLRYVLAKRHGENLESCYTAVIEPYRSVSKIASVEKLTVTVDGTEVSSMNANAVKVSLTSGRTDYIINAVDPTVTYTVIDGTDNFLFSGFFGVWTKENGTDHYYLNDGTRLADFTADANALTGTVTDFTRDLSVENEVIVTLDHAVDPASLAGKYVYMESEPNNNASYEIKSAVYDENGRLHLNIGDVTTVNCYADKFDFSKGYIYDVAEGRTLYIPRSATK